VGERRFKIRTGVCADLTPSRTGCWRCVPQHRAPFRPDNVLMWICVAAWRALGVFAQGRDAFSDGGGFTRRRMPPSGLMVCDGTLVRAHSHAPITGPTIHNADGYGLASRRTRLIIRSHAGPVRRKPFHSPRNNTPKRVWYISPSTTAGDNRFSLVHVTKEIRARLRVIVLMRQTDGTAMVASAFVPRNNHLLETRCRTIQSPRWRSQ